MIEIPGGGAVALGVRGRGDFKDGPCLPHSAFGGRGEGICLLFVGLLRGGYRRVARRDIARRSVLMARAATLSRVVLDSPTEQRRGRLQDVLLTCGWNGGMSCHGLAWLGWLINLFFCLFLLVSFVFVGLL